MPDPVTLTVFTTFRDVSRYFDETIRSVLEQSFRDFEYLIINDGDPGQSRRIRAAHPDERLRIIDQVPEGRTTAERIAQARNRGLREARGEFIAFIDADDRCEPGRFQRQVSFLKTNGDHVLIGSALRLMDEESRGMGIRVYPENDRDIRRKLLVFNCIAQPAVMARREALLQTGGYDLAFADTEDYDLWLRLARVGRFHNFPEPLTAYRIHPGAGKSARLKDALRGSIRVKLRAIRSYGYRPGPAALASLALHVALLPLPSRLIFALFRRLMVFGQTR